MSLTGERLGWRVGMRLGAPCLAILLALAGCERSTPVGNPHYVLGQAWQAQGVWHYPFQSLELSETGLAATYGRDHPTLTANGEVYDPALLTAAHQTLQLPAVIRLTNLENGLQTLVRVNDRGPANPARILAVTPRVAALLEFPAAGTARVRLEVLQTESREAAEAVRGGSAIRLDVATAPRGRVEQETLAPPPGIQAAGGTASVAAGSAPGGAAEPAPAVPAVRQLPETVTRTAPAPGALWVRLGSFSRVEFARMRLAQVRGLGARIEKIRNGRAADYRVTIGPLDRVSDADAVLARVIAAGITDGRIVIE